MPTRSLAFAVPVLAAAALGLSACGDSGGDSTSAGANDDADAARIRFEQCLRRNGVDVPDGPGATGSRPRNVDIEKMEQAMKACERYREEAFGNLTDEQRQEFRDAFARFAACMRRHGVDVPYPPAPGSKGAGAVRRMERITPREMQAAEACRKELPNSGEGGPRGGIVIGPGPAR